MQAVTKVIKAIGPKLNLSESHPVENLSPDEAKRYLTRNKLKFCVLVVDAEAINDVYENLPKQKVEYEELLETVANEVGKTRDHSPKFSKIFKQLVQFRYILISSSVKWLFNGY